MFTPPTPEENQFAHKVARGPVSVLSLLVMLKSFQRLGYFPRRDERYSCRDHDSYSGPV